MTLDSRRSAILAAMGIEAWYPRSAAVAEVAGAPTHVDTADVRVDAAPPWNVAKHSTPAKSVRVRPSLEPSREAPNSSAPGASAQPAGTSSATEPVSGPAFEPVTLRLWRTARMLFIVAIDDPAPVRFLGDVQRALDNEPAFGLRDLPPFAWPPREHPELGNAASLRSAWGALLRRIHREQPLSLVLVFGGAARPRLGDMAGLTQDVGAIEPSPQVHVAPLLSELLGSAAARRSLWTELRGR